ncbi:MAG: methylenetetrahydrofolate reductase [Rhodobacteraceae bacterium]|nr:methylenetetrahydrofolate reductase [Paracoccaceae bacterium]
MNRTDQLQAPATRWLLRSASVEVMPRTLAKIRDLRAILPVPRQIFIAHIDGTPISDMVDAARRLRAEGFDPVPHVPARLVPDAATLTDWLARYRGEADVGAVLALAGSPARPAGSFSDSMAMLDTGAFDNAGITDIHVAGHPEGNRDIDADGGERAVMEAARWKQAFGERTGARITMVTQFVFDAQPVIDWTERLAAEGIDLPVRVGLAGPARLQTLIRFGITCGVGASLGVLQRRAKDVTKLLKPQDPGPLLDAFASHGAGQTGSMIRGVHFFPLGGIAATAEMISRSQSASGRPAA